MRLFRKRKKYTKYYDIGDTVTCKLLKRPYSPQRGYVTHMLIMQDIPLNYSTSFAVIQSFHCNNLMSCRMLLTEKKSDV